MKKQLLIIALLLTTAKLFAQEHPANKRTVDSLLKNMEQFDVDSNGNIHRIGQPVIKESGKPKITVIHLDCRDKFGSDVAQAALNSITEKSIDEHINEVDDYGDQLPHFVMQHRLTIWDNIYK